MADFDNTNTFALFRNDKEGNEKRPDRTGYINIDGKEYWLSGWNRNNGVVSGTVKPKDDWVKPETREKFKKDVVAEVDENEEIDLGSIPF